MIIHLAILALWRLILNLFASFAPLRFVFIYSGQIRFSRSAAPNILMVVHSLLNAKGWRLLSGGGKHPSSHQRCQLLVAAPSPSANHLEHLGGNLSSTR